jgi:tetratricopeptide (TPR) repeat protein
MTEERWHRLKNTLQAAWAMDAEERRAFLDQSCAHDAKLRSNVEALLASDWNIGEFLAVPAIYLTGDPEADDLGDYWTGRHVGPYQILREIGHGGMGTVYLAERADGQYEKQVAIKLLNPQFDDRHFLRRFLRERQVLAGLEHPNVVRLLDGGATENGLPYLVLEHVEGVRIDAWCEARKLPVFDRVRLLQNVCAAVEYAHRQRVIHLDIKPGNILVTADGVPKLLDFGVARVFNPERFAETTETSPGSRPMTPAYASPEQIRGEPVGPTADIYALGLVLYRLLTGHLPHTGIREYEGAGPGLSAVRRELDGDLDSIVQRALNQEPSGRYSSAAELSDDLDRYLNDRPVRARKASFLYRGRRLMKRHRLAASLVTALLAASILVLAISRTRPATSKSSIVAGPVELHPTEEPLPGPVVPSAPKSMAGVALTANLDALKAYQEGISYKTRFRPVEARKALQRAIDLDPQFVMAHYHLADSMRFDGNVTEARRSIARAVQLAEHAAVPPLQRLMAQALQMRLDSRLDEAAKMLEAVHREFPLEIDPLFQLASIRAGCAGFAEAAILLEKVIRLDGRHALAHDQLGYQYAFLGDVGRAVASIDHYAALLPPGNEVPFCSRGDAYMINERYDEAIAQYRKINYLGPMAMAALHAGDYGLPESVVQRLHKNGTTRFGVLADLAAARGQLDQAVPYYEAAVTKYQADGPLRPWFGLLSAARIYLEQFRPEDALALGLRHHHPWAAGLRGTAYLLLHQEAEAEKEFAALHHTIAPILGDYVADETVEFHRMQAASYAGRFDRVLEMWPRLPRCWWSLYALDVGRAYLRSGLFTEAEHHLRLALKAQQAYFMNTDMQAQHNLLTWMLAQFYLAEVLEKTGRRAEAFTHYQAFLKHFDGSLPLPQIDAARAVVTQFRLSERGNVLFSDEFSGNTLKPGWTNDRGAGNWQVAGGLVTVSRRPREAGLTARSRLIAYRDAIFEFSFRTDGNGWIGLILGREDRVLAHLVLGPGAVILKVLESGESGGSDLAPLDRLTTAIERGTWHNVVVEIHGRRIIAQLDGRPAVAGESPALDIEKSDFGVSVEGASASFDYVRMYERASK